MKTETHFIRLRLLHCLTRLFAFAGAAAIWAALGTAHAESKGDFNADGKSDILWQNTSTGARTIWLMNGTVFTGQFALKTRPTSVDFAGAGDFNADGFADVLLQTTSGARSILLLGGPVGHSLPNEVSLGSVAVSWQIVGAGDFNGDGKPDILWQNTSTGARTVWFMNGTTFSGSVSLGTVAPAWSIAASADFSGDGETDILWQHTSGIRLIWLMNGTTHTSSVNLGTVGTAWDIAGAGDFNNDGKADILWQNTVTGARTVWLMNGTTFNSSVSLGTVGTSWQIVNY